METKPAKETKVSSLHAEPSITKITTIKLSEVTMARLDHVRLYQRETYEEIMIRLLEVLNMVRANPEHARISLLKLDKERRKNLKLPILNKHKQRGESYHAN